jgi:hypothetical protein
MDTPNHEKIIWIRCIKTLEKKRKRPESAVLEASEGKSKLEDSNAIQRQLSDTDRELESTR